MRYERRLFREALVPMTGRQPSASETLHEMPDTSSPMGSPTDEFDVLYREHAPAVLAYCLRRASPDVAEEAVSETFAIAWRRGADTPDSQLAWLLGIARRVLANERGAVRRRRALSERIAVQPMPAPGSPDPPPILEALSRLPAADQEVLMLAAWEGLRSEEAALVLGCSPVAYRIRLHRARRRLTQTWTEGDEESSNGLRVEAALQAEETRT